MRGRSCLIASVVVFFVAHAAGAASVQVNLAPEDFDNRVESVTMLDVDGKLFDAEFFHGAAFVGLPAPAISFSTEAEAEMAASALAAALNDAQIAPAALDTTEVFVPFTFPQPGLVASLQIDATGGPTLPLRLVYDLGTPALGDVTSAVELTQAFVVFTAVPEPPSFFLGMMMSAAGLVGRRREPAFSLVN